MEIALIFSSIVFPVLGLVAIVGAWRKRQREQEASPQDWRDNSLEEWRRERDARAAAEREMCAARVRELYSGGETEEVTETQRHQRLGG